MAKNNFGKLYLYYWVVDDKLPRGNYKSLHKMNNNVDNGYKFKEFEDIILHNIDYFSQIYGNNKMDYTSLLQYKIFLTHSMLNSHTVSDTSSY